MFECVICGVFIALVGGRFDNGSNAGLWYWNYNNASSLANTTVGARLLILGFGVFCTGVFSVRQALVGGNWGNTTQAGLWYWNFNWSGTDYNTNVGARLLIFINYLHIIFLAPWQKLVALGWSQK